MKRSREAVRSEAADKSARAMNTALREATKDFTQDDRPKSTQRFVKLTADQITTRPGLFQPRLMTVWHWDVDAAHVKELTGRIKQRGELDPILVMKIGGTWVCVDGHHRLAAYRQAKHTAPIKCAWFAGTPREAVAQAVRENDKAKKELSRVDKLEAAWKHTLNGWGSKAEVAKLCGVSERTVGNMRHIREEYRKGTEGGKRLRERLQRLEDATWGQVRMVWAGLETKGRDLEERAQALANRIRERLTGKYALTYDAMATARALMILGDKLPLELKEAFARLDAPPRDTGAAEHPSEELEYRDAVSDDELQELADHHELEARRAREEIERRTKTTKSTLIWRGWLKEAEEAKEGD